MFIGLWREFKVPECVVKTKIKLLELLRTQKMNSAIDLAPSINP
jgi:hypothetical protein